MREEIVPHHVMRWSVFPCNVSFDPDGYPYIQEASQKDFDRF